MKSWRDKLEKSLASVNESSQRFKQQVQHAVQQAPNGANVLAAVTTAAACAAPGAAGAPQLQLQEQQHAPEPQKYLRLPVESAKRLRWFDRQDLTLLMQVHLREKQELFEANNALRQVLRRRGVADSGLETELALINSQVDAIRTQEEGVNHVLVLAAQAEVEHLKDALDSAHHELQHMRRQRLQVASSGTLSLPAAMAVTQQQRQQQVAAAGERVALLLACSDDEVAVGLEVKPESGATAAAAAAGSSSQGTPALPAALSALVQAAAAGSSCSNGAVDTQLLQQAAAVLLQLAQAQGMLRPRLASATPPAVVANGELASPGTASETSPGGANWQEQCIMLRLQVGRLEAELLQAEQNAAFAKDAAERKAQEMRNRIAEAQQRQGELLSMAQDSRLEAESRCEAAEHKLQLAEAQCDRLESEIKDLKVEVKNAHQETKQHEKEAAAAATAAQRAKGFAETDAKSLEMVQRARARIAELEVAAQQQQRQLVTARQQHDAMEARLATAELATARAMQEVHELEEVVHERDAMAVRLSMLEARLDETRVERGQVESYRTLAQQSEEKRAQAEDELVSTARLAASLEARLAAVGRDNEALQLEVQSAAARVTQAQQSVSHLVQERWLAAGTDRMQWPLAAQEEIENVEARLSAMLAALKEAQAQLAEVQAVAQAHRTACASAERATAAAQDRAERQQREAEQRLQRLEAAASAASVQMAEFRTALADVERERDQLVAEKAERERASRDAAATVAAARRRIGSGALPAGEEAGGAAALLAGLPAPGALLSSGAGNGGVPLPTLKQRDTLEQTDVLYLKNVILKFIDAHVSHSGRNQECEVLLPAVAMLLRASPAEYRALRAHIKSGGSWLPALMG